MTGLTKPGVLMVTGAYFPEVSGAGLQCRTLIGSLRDRVDFAVLTTTADPSLPVDALQDGVPVFRVFIDPTSWWSKLTGSVRLTRFFVRHARRFSIVHFHGFSQKSMLLVALGLATGKRIGIKLTSVGHDDPASMKARGSAVYWCYSQARMFFGVSPRFQTLYEASDLPRDRFRLIPNGVDLERFRPASTGERQALRRELGLPADGPVILFVGFFSREKCPDVLFDAWAHAAAAGDASSRLVFVGATRSTYYEVDGQLADDIRARASRLGLADRLSFVESTSEIDKYERAADVFVLPSVREGLPNALLEAMACGVACIATALEGVTDTLIADGESGILIPPRDAAALETALTRLLTQPDLAQAMGARARQRIEREFALAQTAPKYLAAYQKNYPMTDRKILRGHDILCFSSIDWQFIWQGHQEIMSTLAANGNRILFVENTGVRTPSMRDLPRVRQRVHNWWRGTKGFRRERENLFIYSPILFPFPYSPIVRRLNRVLLVRALRRWMRAIGFGRPIVWTFLPTPLVRDTMPAMDPLVSVYYCIDDFASSSKEARKITESEQQVFAEADLVFVTSEKLRERAARFSKHVHVFPFGVSFRKFEQAQAAKDPGPADLTALKRPVVGYVGGIHQWMDLELIARVARQMPDTSFAFVGPSQVDLSGLAGIPNLHWFGKRSHDELPSYIKGFDVGIVPYLLTDYTANVYPTKLNEYLAMGIPVVATDLPEIRRFNVDHGPSVAVAGTADQFVAALTNALRPSTDDDRARRTTVARKNSWDARIGEMSWLIEDTLEAKRSRPEPWEATLRRLYRRARGRVAAVVGLTLLVYFLLFQTSLPWALAEPLRVSEPPRAADAIVVFAGGVGESGQAGGGYQERVKTAVELYQQGFAPRMVFESGYAFAFKEAEIMRDLAMSLGVPESAIVLETHGINTYDDVIRVREVLRQNQWSRILLVSSPYNMKRAIAVWRKQAPEIDVVATPVPKSQFYTHGRGASLNQLRGLTREYGAFAAYWWRGWI